MACRQYQKKLTWDGLFAHQGPNAQPKKVRVVSFESAVVFKQLGFDVKRQQDDSFIVSYIPST